VVGLATAHNCHRIGTEKPVNIFYLIAHGTIEEKLANVLQQKQSVFGQAIDGDASTGALDIYDMLTKALKTP